MSFKRFNVSLNENVLLYLDSEAERIGLSRSGMMALLIDEYKTRRDFKSFELEKEEKNGK